MTNIKRLLTLNKLIIKLKMLAGKKRQNSTVLNQSDFQKPTSSAISGSEQLMLKSPSLEPLKGSTQSTIHQA